MQTHSFANSTLVGTLGGTTLTILVNISSADLLKTTLLAAIGAVVSFGVTLGLKFAIRKIKKILP
ncbi:hypothetical protein [Ferruginibacter sp. HRS2-29]|uniref:hypothetical protein n=1 Tax=Ferruginibacter sp. HRS2-29 TaxID=2487334 RepID=UPI0020CC194B|nr:hypothetical protein [Ferruginibacter sp. HRS2-29]MCP9752435.1 hypothetical protein [Ferruginibacter sp. HRS2-29]